MEELKNRSFADTFNAKLRTPWVWLVILITLGLTALFYASQKPQITIYSECIKVLSDYQRMDANVMRSMDHVRSGYGADSVTVLSQTMMLRELAVAFSREMDDLKQVGIKTPSDNATGMFERGVLSRVANMRRYLGGRLRWHHSYDSLMAELANFKSVSPSIHLMMDSVRAGFPISRPEVLALPDTLLSKLDTLLEKNKEMAYDWSRFDNDVSIMNTEELIQFFQMENLGEMSLKSKIPMVFYFLTIVLLLSTFFFIFHSKQ